MAVSGVDVSWRAVGAGALIAAAIAVPASLISLALNDADDVGDDSSIVFVFLVVVIFGLGFGGAMAASRRPDAPLTHGALTALTAFAAIQVIGVIRRLVADDPISWVGIVFSATVAATAGVVGGLVADRLARRR